MQRYQASLLITTGIWVLLACLSGCASSPDAPGFTKVKYTHVKDAGVNLDSLSIDPMIRFEREHYMHGAVTMEQRRQRLGHYYTFSWNAPANPSPVTLRFEHRHSRTGEQVFTHDQLVREVKSRNKTALRVTGESYHRHGRVVAWQATLLQDGKVLDQERSFLWN